MEQERMISHQSDMRRSSARALALWAIVVGLSMCALAGLRAALSTKIPVQFDQTADYSTDSCRRITLIDRDTGRSVIGAEDLAYDPHGQRIFISAYDRRATEQATRTNRTKRSSFEGQGHQTAIPSGGLYVIGLDELSRDNPSTARHVTSLVHPDDIAGGLRPHGLTYNMNADEVVFINRTYTQTQQGWTMKPTLERVGSHGAVVIGPTQPAVCHANDVALLGDDPLLSFDHGACGRAAVIEDIFNMKRSGLINIASQKNITRQTGFANGVTVTGTDQIVLAATRENSLHLYDTGGNTENPAKITLPGGPDNVTLASDGSIIAAVHPSLLRMGLHRKLGIGNAPSRILRIDPDTFDIDLLFDDPDGSLFSAATVAVLHKQMLIVGSVTDHGLLVCTL